MPNWCYNELEVSITVEPELKDKAKKQLKEFKSKCIIKEKGEQRFDFNQVIPMPKSLEITSGSSVSNAMAVIKYEEGDNELIKTMLKYSWVKEQGIKSMKKLYEELNKDVSLSDRQEARISIDNEKKYGYANWYDWSCIKWGTKWNAKSTYIHDAEDGYMNIDFETAWSPPVPIIEELIIQYPLLTFALMFKEAGMGFEGVMIGCKHTDKYHYDIKDIEYEEEEETSFPFDKINLN
tara:strand:+ start:267 stop:974 length:708 start_codon:yes stop_codon:yes gene_type:complete